MFQNALKISFFALACAGCGEVFVATGGGAAGGEGGSGASQTTSATTGEGGTSSSTTSSSTGGGEACSAPPSNECNNCLYETCTDPYCACAGYAPCVSLAACIGEAKPVEYCWQTNKEGISTLGLLLACGSSNCNCGYDPVSDCEICQFKECPAEVNECLSTAACVSYLGCWQNCKGEPSCQQDCNANFATGQSKAQALFGCVLDNCGSDCK
ncbi:MAG: hypothetical protein IPK82_38610 [Polyangiaceae bacterium]|nr:hypothetical protein [Polyangiaceae bacterium]